MKNFALLWNSGPGDALEAASTYSNDRARILELLDRFQAGSTPNDRLVLFLTGHVGNDKSGAYYFLPSDFKREHVRSTALDLTEVERVITSFSGRLFLFLDGHVVNLGGIPDQNALANLANPETGAIVFSSCQASEEAADGAYGKALVEGFRGGAVDKDGKVTLRSLESFLEKRVAELTGDRQHPFLATPPGTPDLTIGVVAKGARSP